MWIEAIHLRSTQHDVNKALDRLNDIMPEISHETSLISLEHFVGNQSVGDLLVEMRWNSEKKDKSRIGLILCRFLEEFGIVQHRIWIEKENGEIR